MKKGTVYLAGGCFWGVEKFFEQFHGITDTSVGYANGPTSEPSYGDVCNGSGHAEAVRLEYDKDKISLTEIIKYFFMIIDPLSVNKQGNDTGIQYRTGIYYEDAADLPEIEAVYNEEQNKVGTPLAVELEPIKNFYPAEEYHRKYLDKNPLGYCHINPKLFGLQKQRFNIENGIESEEELKKRIGALSFEVTQRAATERPFTGEYDNFFEKGIYVDIVSGEPLFSSEDKYNSGCGWPAFTKPIDKNILIEKTDLSYGMVRTEVISKEASSHLGHVFDDGPKDRGGLRYCINSASLRFIPYDELEKQGYGEYKKLFDK